MANGMNSITLGTSLMYVLILTDNKGNKMNAWSPPNVLAIPVDLQDAEQQTFDMDALTSIPQYKRRALAEILLKLNERDAGDYRWTAYRLMICDDGGLAFTVKAHSPTVGEEEEEGSVDSGNTKNLLGNTSLTNHAFGGVGSQQAFAAVPVSQSGFGGNQVHLVPVHQQGSGFGSGHQDGYGHGNQPGFGGGSYGGFGGNSAFDSGGFGGSKGFINDDSNL